MYHNVKLDSKDWKDILEFINYTTIALAFCGDKLFGAIYPVVMLICVILVICAGIEMIRKKKMEKLAIENP